MSHLLVLVALLWAAPAQAAQAVAVSVEKLARESDAVVRGRVTAARAQRSDDGLRIFTTFTLRARAVLRGKAPALSRVRVPGGVVGKMGQRVDAAPRLAEGEEVVLFLRRTGDVFQVRGLAQGKFTVDGATARPDLSGYQFVASSVKPGERRSEEMPLEELERRVRATR